ncbi:NACHT, LRR and PYD domains-containing protein 1 homolog [Garra rufa]|uniref:NACHT, LRR and PYD domains-containing protein 1 homolog n=1 Tax=Garra rufa TaxID=137080 RepID=UPI003CCE5CA8
MASTTQWANLCLEAQLPFCCPLVLQLTDFGQETWTIPSCGNCTLHLGNIHVPPGRTVIKGSEGWGAKLKAGHGGQRHSCALIDSLACKNGSLAGSWDRLAGAALAAAATGTPPRPTAVATAAALLAIYPPFGELDWTERNQKRDLVWQKMVCQYKKSVDLKYRHQNERSVLSGERVSPFALYTEPVIIQENIQKDIFPNITVEEMFRSSRRRFNHTLILHGNSGCGKSFIAQQIMLDWASEKHYLKDFDLAFYLRFEELECISEEMNLIELLSWNCSLPSDQISKMLQNSAQRVLFIIDGLDDLRLMCDEFYISKFQRAPPEVIVGSLLHERNLPRSVRMITTRTEVPPDMLLTRCFRIVGFSEKGVEEYFQKFFQNEELFRNAYECVRANETLITVCSIPVICWIICTVIQERLSDCANVINGLETTTSIYVDFVSALLEHHCQNLSRTLPSLLRSLGQLAEKGMLEQQVLFDEKTVNETVSDPVGSLSMYRFLSKRRIHQETMFSFINYSFQEFFAALYYVLLDEEESQRKVKELLHTVERGWALSCWSDRDFSKANLEISHSKLLQPVILFLCGLCKKEWITRFSKKHNMAVSVSIETQLKEWINQCAWRYQNEHMLFTLHCLYELHEKRFIGKVLEQLVSIDLSNILLKNADCWMLRFCFQNCVNIGKLRLNITSDNLKILQSALYSCEELWLKVDHITDDTGDLISALGEGKIVKELIRRKSVLIKRDRKSFTEEELKTIKTENIESKRYGGIPIRIRGSFFTLLQSSGYAEVFTPERVQADDKDKPKTFYRFVCPHAGQFQCSLTSLVFVMEGEGEVLYRVVSWDPRLLDGLGQMQPAGPLYNIDCFNGSISGLHLPHCEILSEENKDSLAVARFTAGNVEIMKPCKVTEAHVMIDIRDLSHFGLFKKMFFPPCPVIAQVLLFLRPRAARKSVNILDVHLLPWNVSLSEVKDQHKESTHIKTSSKCSLTPGSKYSLCCEPRESRVQPEAEKFECNFGPNYHPTFEVFVGVNIEEITLSLLDKTKGKEVWEPRQIFITGKDAEPPAHKRLTECEFVKKHRDKLIQRVSSGMAIADGLRTKDMIPVEMYNKVHAAETPQEKVRHLLDVLDSGGAAVKAEFYRLLKENERYLVDELESGHSGQQ